MRSRLIKLLIALCATAWAPMAPTAERGPLVLETKIPSGDEGRPAVWVFRPVDTN